MTLQDIQNRINYIRSVAYNDEVAHSKEDSLRDEFIAYIAGLTEPDPDLSAKAALVLTTDSIEFARWCD